MMNSDRNFVHKLLVFLENKAHVIIAINTLIILSVTLLPFDFSIPYSLSVDYIINTFRQATNFNDIVVNILLFFPFGLGLAAFLQHKIKSKYQVIIIIFIVSFLFSLTVEICQLFLISRNPTFSDVITNSSGGFMGGVIFFIFKKNQQKISQNVSFLSIFNKIFTPLKSLTILWLLYFFIIAIMLIDVQDSTKLNNWDRKFHLMIGNEEIGDRPWSGKVSSLCITKNALSQQEIKRLLPTNNFCEILTNNPDELVTAYVFNDSQTAYFDLTRNLPNLDNQKKSRTPISSQGIVVDRENWLKTTSPAIKLTQEIQNSSKFTIFTKIATTNFQQEGPARIVSLSQNHLWRNFTIAQWRDALIFRVRMPLTGTNGKEPEIRINNFFTNTDSRQLAIAYDGIRLKIYIDNVANAKKLYLGAEAALFWSFFATFAEKMSLNVDNNLFYLILYYGFMFAPLGIFGGMIVKLLRTHLLGCLILIIGGLIIPPLLIEAIIVSSSNRPWSWSYLSLGITTLAISFVLTKVFLPKKRIRLTPHN